FFVCRVGPCCQQGSFARHAPWFRRGPRMAGPDRRAVDGPGTLTVDGAAIPYSMLVLSMVQKCCGDSAQDHGGRTAGASREGAASQRYRHHPDGPYRAAACCGVADLRSPAPTPRQGPLHAYVGRAQGRPMIAANMSTWVAFLEGAGGEDAKLLDGALEDRQVLMVPVVLTELLSDPKLPSAVAETLAEVPLVEIEPGYWQRAAT